MIPRKSKRGRGGGAAGRITGNNAQGGKRSSRGQHPLLLYNTDFSVWECIIIIGGGLGARRGGVTAK